MKCTFTREEARILGQGVGMNFAEIDLEQFKLGLTVELEHGSHDSETNVTNDDLTLTSKITWAHLKEIPNYYSWLIKMEAEYEYHPK